MTFFSSLALRSLLSALFCCLLFSTDGLHAGGLSPVPSATRQHLKETMITEARSGLRGVDCIYVINLGSRPEKWARVNALLKSSGLTPNRFSAVIGKNLSARIKTSLAGHYPVRLTDGEYGCLLSHVSVIKDAYKRGYHRIWICEDDIDVIEDLKQLPQLLNRLTRIDPKWDVFYTDLETKNSDGLRIPSVDGDFRPDFNYPDKAIYLEKKIVGKELMSIKQRFGMYSYFLSRSGMKKVLDYFTHVPVWSAIDIDIHYVPDLKEYSPTKDYVSIWYKSPISDIVHSDRSEAVLDLATVADNDESSDIFKRRIFEERNKKWRGKDQIVEKRKR